MRHSRRNSGRGMRRGDVVRARYSWAPGKGVLLHNIRASASSEDSVNVGMVTGSMKGRIISVRAGDLEPAVASGSEVSLARKLLKGTAHGFKKGDSVLYFVGGSFEPATVIRTRSDGVVEMQTSKGRVAQHQRLVRKAQKNPRVRKRRQQRPVAWARSAMMEARERNDHTGAMLILAKAMESPTYIKKIHKIRRIERRFGYIPHDVYEERRKLRNRMLAQIKRQHGDKVYRALRAAM